MTTPHPTSAAAAPLAARGPGRSFSVAPLLTGTLLLIATSPWANVNGLWSVLSWAILATLGGLSLVWPVPAAALVGVMLTLMYAVPALATGLGVLVSPVSLAICMARGSWRLGLPLAVWHTAVLVLATLRTTNTSEEFLAGAAVWVFFIALALLVGHWMGRAVRDLSRAERQRLADLEEQRRLIARELHDTAVRATTEVVLLAETAQSRAGLDPEAARDFARISRTARLATDELRTMMEQLRQAEGPPGSIAPAAVRASTWEDVLAARIDRLSLLGFDVRTHSESDSPVPREALGTLARCLDEVVANVHRHGDPSRSVSVFAQATASAVEVAVMNGIDPEDAPVPRGGDGLRGIRERLEPLRGTLEAHAEGTTFVTRLSIPLPLPQELA
ncbi:hypothetical protein JSY14_09370 [Brachybacterium sp. EF45031]|uniref:sensor histidine kinase n=1 Tax=Brachybacterium sillae TaxID=2810536 RepID=UPI00217D8C75|nr:histidine kinase [Brachybacterium sillae]MCS6712218.1 hypothetical protein [Brachybacterium sillae]